MHMKKLAAALAAVAITGAFAACGDDDDSTSATSAPAGSSSTASPSTENRATAQPAIKIGWLNPGVGTGSTYPHSTDAAQAAVKYINTELGGVDGHPLELLPCESDASPESDAACAQKVAAQDPLIMSMVQIFNMSGVYKAIQPKQIPLVAGTQTVPQDFTAKDAFFMTSGTLGFLSAAGGWLVQNLKPKSVSIVYDNPAAAQGLALLTDPIKASGAKVTTEKFVDPKQANWLSVYRSLTEGDPDYVVAMFGSPQSCIGLAKASQSQHDGQKVFANSTCMDSSAVKALGTAMDGWYQASIDIEQETSNPSDEFKTYKEKMEQYGPGTETVDNHSSAAFSIIMNIHKVFAGIGYDNLKRPEIVKYLQTTPLKSWIGGEVDCSKAPKEQPTTCNNQYRVYQFKGKELVGGELFTPAA